MADYKQYEINETDVDKVMAYLKTVDPERATPENAISFLEYYQTVFHQLGHKLTGEEMQQLYEKFADKNKFES